MDIGGRRRAEKRGIRYVRFLYSGDSILLSVPPDWKMVPFGSTGNLDNYSVLLPLVLYDLGRIREQTKGI